MSLPCGTLCEPSDERTASLSHHMGISLVLPTFFLIHFFHNTFPCLPSAFQFSPFSFNTLTSSFILYFNSVRIAFSLSMALSLLI